MENSCFFSAFLRNNSVIGEGYGNCSSSIDQSVSGSNPLILACGSLLSLVLVLKHNSSQHYHLEELLDEVSCKFEVCDRQIKAYGYDTQIRMTAEVAVIFFLDIQITTNNFGRESCWQKGTLFQHFFHEQLDDERIFALMAEILKNPEQHLDLIELLYLGISSIASEANFQINKYHNLLSEVYRTIIKWRKPQAKETLIHSYHCNASLKNSCKKFRIISTPMLLLIFAFVANGLIYYMTELEIDKYLQRKYGIEMSYPN